MKRHSATGLVIALLVITAWAVCITCLMQWHINWYSPLTYVFVFIQMHLYTGLFITAHDAMHGTVHRNPLVNSITGQVCTALYALFPYKKLLVKHHEHHRYVHTSQDPDYYEGGILKWYISFISAYLSWWQLIAMAVVYNVLKIWIAEANLLIFWVVPSLLSTVQLFYFGTWLPHHGSHANRHQSRTQDKNHFFAFISCYFFGYHYEHHDAPGVPWWRLWKLKG